jgi:hypothetical protein
MQPRICKLTGRTQLREAGERRRARQNRYHTHAAMAKMSLLSSITMRAGTTVLPAPLRTATARGAPDRLHTAGWLAMLHGVARAPDASCARLCTATATARTRPDPLLLNGVLDLGERARLAAVCKRLRAGSHPPGAAQLGAQRAHARDAHAVALQVDVRELRERRKVRQQRAHAAVAKIKVPH